MFDRQLIATNRSFADETTIHGVREAFRTRSIFVRCLWIFILLGCFCGVTYEIYQIVLYYQSNPSASQVKWVLKEQYDYPPMVFCPKTFLDLEKVQRLNMSKSALAYTVSLFQTVHKSSLPADFQLEAARNEVKTIMKKHKLRRYIQLFEAISLNKSDVLQYAITKKPIKLEVFVPGYGLCFQMFLPAVKASTIKSINHLEIEHTPTDRTTEYDFIHPAALVVRESTGMKADMILLPKNAYYQIDFQVQLHKRLSNPGMECLSPSQMSENYYVADCEFDCMAREKFNSRCQDCLPYNLLNESSNVEPCPSFVDPDANPTVVSGWCEDDNIITRSTKCLKTCLPVCEQWIFKHTTLVFDNYNTSIYMRFLYNPSDGILTYEEVATYNFDTFISNIGGQLGLWLGASVVSIFQIFYYSILAIFKRRGDCKDVSKI